MARRAARRAASLKVGFDRARPRVRDHEGKPVMLKWNEPRPDLAIKVITSLRVARGGLGLARVRLEVEDILQSGCGRRRIIERLQRLGPAVADVLVKIASSDADCSCGGACAGAAIDALGYFPTAAAADCLRRIAFDPQADVGVRATALTALGRIGTPSGVEALRRVLSEARDADLRLAAARGLAYGRSAAALEVLTTAAERDANTRVRRIAHDAAKGIAEFNRLPPPRLTPTTPPRLAQPQRSEPPW
jgi:hypothetical protein